MSELPAAASYQLSVAATSDVGPRMRRVALTGAQLADFTALPGQDVVLHLADAAGGGVSRRYTIRHLDPPGCRFDLDVVMHGDGPGARWASTAAVGTVIDVFGPRGKVRPATAGWQLFVGDDSALPAIAEMVAALPPTTAAVAIIEVTDNDDEQELDAAGRPDVRWLHRDPKPAGGSELFEAALADIAVPPDDRHAYVFGESRVVRRIREVLLGRGLSLAEISAQGYWNVGRSTSD